jgi:predicted ATP-dependent endonuclease of OLD family
MSESNASYKVIRLEVENVKRLKAAEIYPHGDLVVVGGQNEQGKSSLLDSILYGLGGARALPPRPVRRGASSAEIVVDLGELVVTRKIAVTGETTLVVSNRDGVKCKKPQEILDRLVGELTFDPLKFANMDAKSQLETLRKMVGLDFSEIDSKRKAMYDERTLANRAARDLQGELKAHRYDPSLPKEETSVNQIVEQLARGKHLLARQSELGVTCESFRREIQELEAQLESAKQDLVAAEVKLSAIKEEVAKLPNQEDVTRQLADIEATNRGVRANLAYTELKRKSTAADVRVLALTTSIEELDAKKKQMVADAKFPIEGLGMGDDQVLLHGVPFSQASSAERTCASVAMGIAMNPKLRVLLIRDGSLLDQKHLELVAKLAADAGTQVWMERVGEGKECQVIIEDGEVRPCPQS